LQGYGLTETCAASCMEAPLNLTAWLHDLHTRASPPFPSSTKCFISQILQGYGLTETCAASCIAVPDDYSLHGTNGPVQPSTEIRLESVPGGC
jgi:long-subunit acyl-CoA synthetase (AMP-forming)